MKKVSVFLFLLGMAAFIGCEYGTQSGQSGPNSESSAPAQTDTPAADQPDNTADEAEKSDGAELEFDESDASQSETVDKEAKAGVTHKGEFAHSSDNPMSIVDVPLATYFTVSEKTVFDMQIPQAMELYKATNGEYPKTEDEFMREIIQANNINLPQLKEGDTYFYDPDTAQLMVHAQK